MGEKQLIIKDLISNKEVLKNKVTDRSISWQERIELYSQIQLINEQIDLLKQSPNLTCNTPSQDGDL